MANDFGKTSFPQLNELIDEQDIAALKGKILASGLSVSQLVLTPGDSKQKFVNDFVAALDKVMNLDRYDLRAVQASSSARGF